MSNSVVLYGFDHSESMKFAIIAVVALAAVAQGFVLRSQDGVELNGNIIDNLIRSALEFIRAQLKEYQPYTLPDIPEESIVDTDVNLKVKISNVKISKAEDFVVEHIENNLPNLWAKFQLKAPSPHVEASFNIEGTAFTKKVSGNGQISIDVTNMDQSGFIQIQMVNHALQIKDITLDYSIDNAKFAVSGLNVEGMTEEQITTFLNTNLLPTLNKNKAEVCEKVANQIKAKGNELMAGKTLAQLIDWLKHFIGH